MAKKTRKDALITRDQILNAAEQLFTEEGVGNTSLQKIALAAGVTRGAIYWHFEDKAAVLQALLDRASMPVDEIIARVVGYDETPAEERILMLVSELINLIMKDSHIRNALIIVTQKMEQVGEMAFMKDRHLAHLEHVVNAFTKLIVDGCQHHEITISQERAIDIARALNAIIDGLFFAWIHDMSAFDLHKIAITTIKTYLYGLLACPNCQASISFELPSLPLK